MTLLTDPNIAFVLFVVGMAGILVELVHPTLLGGVVGALCLVLAFIGLSSLPLNAAGLVLVAFGMILFALESQVATHGILAAGGLAVFVLGASVFYAAPPGSRAPVDSVAAPVIAAAAGSFAVFMGVMVWAAIRVRRLPAQRDGVGTTPVPGTAGTVQAPLSPVGTVHLAGEIWSARSVDGRALDRGTPVSLVAIDGLVAVVAAASVVPPGTLPPSPPRPPAQSPAAPPAVRP